MKILLAPDSFKGSLSAVEVCRIAAAALRESIKDVTVQAIPVADGGEGTVDSFVFAIGAERRETVVTGPRGLKVCAAYAVAGDTAIIEMAQASGLPLMLGQPNAKKATTLGTGELIKKAAADGCRKLVIGIGGSATTDGGLGCLSALGVRFTDEAGQPVSPDGEGLAQVAHIDVSGLDPAVKQCEITVLCDVTNPLFGPNGAAAVYGPQKGADPETVAFLDDALRHYAAVVRDSLGVDAADEPGAGAAGGLGYALKVFLNAEMKSGAQAVLDLCGFDEKAKDADWVITGEGKFDRQSLMGKLPGEIARRLGGKNAAVLCGAAALSEEQAKQAGYRFVQESNPLHLPFEAILPHCAEMLYEAVCAAAERIRVDGSR